MSYYISTGTRGRDAVRYFVCSCGNVMTQTLGEVVENVVICRRPIGTVGGVPGCGARFAPRAATSVWHEARPEAAARSPGWLKQTVRRLLGRSSGPRYEPLL